MSALYTVPAKLKMHATYHEQDKRAHSLERRQHVGEHGGGGGEGRQKHGAGRLAVAGPQPVHELFVVRHHVVFVLAIKEVAGALERIHHNKNIVHGNAQAHEDDEEVDGAKI